MNVKTNMKFAIGSKVRLKLKNGELIGTILKVVAIERYEYVVDFHVTKLLCKEDELELVEEEEEVKMNFKVGDKVRTLMQYTNSNFKRFPVGTIGDVTAVECGPKYNIRVEIANARCDSWYYYKEDELELVEETEEEKEEEMKFKVGDRVRILVRVSNRYCQRFEVGTIGVITKIDQNKCSCPYTVYVEGVGHCYDENELELVEEKEENEEEENTNMKTRGKLGTMLECKRCGEKEFVESTSDLEATELIEDLEFDSGVMDRWGEINGLILCPNCTDYYNEFFAEFMKTEHKE